MRRLLFRLAILGVIAAGAGWIWSAPKTEPSGSLASIEPDLARGEYVFTASGCASCHKAPSSGADRLVLAGGQSFPSDFGTFYAPNISPHPVQGIGGWTVDDLLNALRHGTSPDGQHYFPAFPYTAYQHMRDEDVVSLHAYLGTLPPSSEPSRPHDVGFPLNVRRAVAGWKLLYFKEDFALSGDLDSQIELGRYLVEGLSHCGECHTPRTALGGLDRDRWMAGAPVPGGRGDVPNITPAKLTWTDFEILDYLVLGFTPEFDAVGGHMVDVVGEMARLPESDVEAIVAYLKAIPAAE